MILYTGNYFCHDSCWGGMYESSYTVGIQNWGKEYSTEDFNKLLGVKKIFDQGRFNDLKESIKDEAKFKALRKHFKETCYENAWFLKPEVVEWLAQNVKDTKLKEKGWAVGTDDYNTNPSSFGIFFHRAKDAKAFIKEWSIYKKPTETWSQRTDKGQKLDLVTNKLVDKK